MKKVIFFTEKLIIGGVERSLLEWVKKLSGSYDITVAVIHAGGDLEPEISRYAKIRVMSEDVPSFREQLWKKAKTGRIGRALNMGFHAYKANKESSYIKQCKHLIHLYDAVEEYYDVAVCFHKPTDVLVPFVAYRVNAGTKYLWLHTEILTTLNADMEEYINVYQEYDKFVCVSNAIRRDLETVLVNRKNDIVTVYNYFNKNDIERKGEDFLPDFDSQNINIVTVGRLSKEKGQDIAIQAARLLKERQVKFQWLFVGEGPYEHELKQMASDLIAENKIAFLGSMKNPYPYIKYCDIYVQPSREEGFGMTIAEAKLFTRPIIVTQFLTASEHITDGYNGRIVPISSEELSEAIMDLINNPDKREKLSKNLTEYQYPIEYEKNFRELFE